MTTLIIFVSIFLAFGCFVAYGAYQVRKEEKHTK